MYGQISFQMEVICLQNLLIEYLEKYNLLKIADMKSMIPFLRQHFFADVKYFELERLDIKQEFIFYFSMFHIIV